MVKKRICIILICILLFGVNIWGGKQEAHSTKRTEFSSESRVSRVQTYIPRSPIYITNDNDLNNSFPGKGTMDNPIRIEGYNITAPSGDMISIHDTTFYFRIANCLLNGLASADRGISLWNVKNGIVENNTVINTFNGILLVSSNDNEILNNTCYNGLTIRESKNNLISRNIVKNHTQDGLLLDSSDNNIVSHNIVTNNFEGIAISFSSDNNIIANNTVHHNPSYGIYVKMSENNTIHDNTITDNGNNGIYLTGSETNTIENNEIDNNGANGIYLENSTRNVITSNIVSHNSQNGINLQTSAQNTITNNEVEQNSRTGVQLLESPVNTISDNFVHGNKRDGINSADSNCFDGTFVNNTISHNSGWGLLFWESGNNRIIDNNFVNDGLGLWGYQYEDFLQVEITNNNVNGKPILYWQDVNDKTVPSDIGQIILLNCHSIIIKDQNIEYASTGITVAYSSNVLISENTLSDGVVGILIYNSSSSSIVNNTLDNYNWDAIRVSDNSNKNRITDNIISNTAYGAAISLGGEKNTIAHNSINNNFYGFYLGWAQNTNITGNTLEGNTYGMTLNEASDNQIFNNTIQNGGEYGVGIDIWQGGERFSTNNTISYNTIRNTAGYGVIMSAKSQANTVEYNVFTGNNDGGVQATDDGSENVFANNYWSEWTSPDTNGDGIVDEPYTLDGTANNQDESPLTSPDPILQSTSKKPASGWTTLLVLLSLVIIRSWKKSRSKLA
ncbi:MAG: right-handed parallel beta-helix repeat-containing protein [Candidatus Heimdallarchaeota archaeon]|nr:MAG: right-handed parallel beta-helix repeat-containing protein [Candidatus Heimdallarchaeota archaeon]